MATFQQRGKRWRAIVRKQGHRSESKTFGTKVAAQRWAREVERDIDLGTFFPASILKRHSVSDLIKRYRAAFSVPSARDGSFRNLERGLGPVTLDMLTKHRIVEFARDRAATGVKPSTIKDDIGYLRGLLDTARAHWDIPVRADLMDDARKLLTHERLIGKSVERDRRPTDAELELLREYWELPAVRRQLTCPMWDVVQFAIATAMRLGEITRIEWGAINKNDKTVLIRDRKHPTMKLGNDLEVPLLPQAWEIVQRQVRHADEPRIFPYKVPSISANFTRACQRTGIQDLRFHDLRHEGTSRLFEAGYQIHEVAIFTGHRDWRQLRRYTQLRARDLHREPTQ